MTNFIKTIIIALISITSTASTAFADSESEIYYYAKQCHSAYTRLHSESKKYESEFDYGAIEVLEIKGRNGYEPEHIIGVILTDITPWGEEKTSYETCVVEKNSYRSIAMLLHSETIIEYFNIYGVRLVAN